MLFISFSEKGNSCKITLEDKWPFTNKPIIAVGGAGEPIHFQELFSNTTIEAVGAASVYHFTQYTPKDVKLAIKDIGLPVRL